MSKTVHQFKWNHKIHELNQCVWRIMCVHLKKFFFYFYCGSNFFPIRWNVLSHRTTVKPLFKRNDALSRKKSIASLRSLLFMCILAAVSIVKCCNLHGVKIFTSKIFSAPTDWWICCFPFHPWLNHHNQTIHMRQCIAIKCTHWHSWLACKPTTMQNIRNMMLST